LKWLINKKIIYFQAEGIVNGFIRYISEKALRMRISQGLSGPGEAFLAG